MATIKVTPKQYRYPDTRSQYERKQDAMEQVTVPVNRQVRPTLRGLYR